MPTTVLKLFISTTAGDLAAYRDTVHDYLADTGIFQCLSQKNMGAHDAGALGFCRESARAADLFVGLIGMRRGWEPDGVNNERSITEIEHDAAKDSGRRRFLWVTPDDFPVPGNLHETRAEHRRQLAFRKRVMDGGERIVSQNGFRSPESLASEIVRRLLIYVATSDLITMLRPDLLSGDVTAQQQAPGVAAAVEKLAEDKDVDLLALAKNPEGVDLADLEAKLKTRAEQHEAAGRQELRVAAEYWGHIGALAFLQDTHKALAAYKKAATLVPADAAFWQTIGLLQFRLGDLEEAEKAQLKALQLDKQLPNKRGMADSYCNLGIIYATRGDLAKAEEIQIEALNLNEELGDKEGMANNFGNLGNIYHARGDLTKAEEMYLKSLNLEDKLGRKQAMANCYCALGLLHKARGDLAKAEDMQHKALRLDKESGHKEGMAIAYGNLGNIYQIRGELPKAEETQLTALRLNEELGRKEGMAACHGNLGNIYKARGDLAKAEEMYLQALRLNGELGRRVGMAINCNNLGNLYAEKSDKRRMCEYWGKAHDLWREMGLADKAAELERLLKEGRCNDAITDLVGSVDGLPADLGARKKKHLKETGYGRKRRRS